MISPQDRSSSRKNDWVRFYIKLLAGMFGAILWMVGLVFSPKLWQSLLTPALVESVRQILLVAMAGSSMALVVVAVLLMLQQIKPTPASLR